MLFISLSIISIFAQTYMSNSCRSATTKYYAYFKKSEESIKESEKKIQEESSDSRAIFSLVVRHLDMISQIKIERAELYTEMMSSCQPKN